MINLAKKNNIKIYEKILYPKDLLTAEEIFLTGTAVEITPVSQIDKFNFSVCDLIKDLSKSYQNLVRKKVAA